VINIQPPKRLTAIPATWSESSESPEPVRRPGSDSPKSSHHDEEEEEDEEGEAYDEEEEEEDMSEDEDVSSLDVSAALLLEEEGEGRVMRERRDLT